MFTHLQDKVTVLHLLYADIGHQALHSGVDMLGPQRR